MRKGLQADVDLVRRVVGVHYGLSPGLLKGMAKKARRRSFRRQHATRIAAYLCVRFRCGSRCEVADALEMDVNEVLLALDKFGSQRNRDAAFAAELYWLEVGLSIVLRPLGAAA